MNKSHSNNNKPIIIIAINVSIFQSATSMRSVRSQTAQSISEAQKEKDGAREGPK